MNIKHTVRSYIKDVIHLSLATCRDNKPWVTEVHYSYDDVLNLYFRSKLAKRHSQDIGLNPFVAGNIVSQHALGEKVRGVYFEGNAILLDSIDANHAAYTTYCDRLGKDTRIIDESFEPEGHKFYKIVVDTFYLFDNRKAQPGIKYELPWQKKDKL